MKIKRHIDVINATYDILNLTRTELAVLLAAYRTEVYLRYNGPTDKDELLNKMEKIIEDEVLTI